MDNGEFYISVADFIERFESFDVCHFMFGQISEDDNPQMNWHRSRIHGSWVEGTKPNFISIQKLQQSLKQ